LAKYYDLLYQWKDYEKEASVVKELVERCKTSQGSSLLDVWCGTGKHLQYLTGKFDCAGMDASEKMREQARRNVREGKFVQGDMVNFNLGRQFDVILCLFSSIGYVRTY
jgi:ubiquinone/menaquinone biosynthesis C-methylase UbiE